MTTSWILSMKFLANEPFRVEAIIFNGIRICVIRQHPDGPKRQKLFLVFVLVNHQPVFAKKLGYNTSIKIQLNNFVFFFNWFFLHFILKFLLSSIRVHWVPRCQLWLLVNTFRVNRIQLSTILLDWWFRPRWQSTALYLVKLLRLSHFRLQSKVWNLECWDC